MPSPLPILTVILTVTLCEHHRLVVMKLVLSQRENDTVSVSQRLVLSRIVGGERKKVEAGFRKIHNGEFHSFYSSQSIKIIT